MLVSFRRSLCPVLILLTLLPTLIVSTVEDDGSNAEIESDFRTRVATLPDRPRRAQSNEDGKPGKTLPFEFFEHQNEILSQFLSASVMDQLAKILVAQPSNASTRCELDIHRVFQGIRKMQFWALNMIDAFGKPGSGLLHGNVRWAGSYSQCQSVISEDGTTSFGGLYCWLHLKPAPNSMLSDRKYKRFTFSSSLCVPDSCSENEISEAIKQSGVLSYINQSLVYYDVQCYSPQKINEKDTKAIVTYIILMVFLFLLAAGTLYDVYKQRFFSCILHPYPTNNTADDNIKKRIDCDDFSYSNEELAQNVTSSEDHKKLAPAGNMGKLLLAFSVYTNGSKVMKMAADKESLPVLNGIRFISLTWVIIYHTYLFTGETLMADNPELQAKALEKFSLQILGQGTFAVDTFLVLSGLLLTYRYLKIHQTNSEKSNWIKFYIHRYLRLTPAYAAVMFLMPTYLWPYWGDGPFWPSTSTAAAGGTCYTSWWWNLLYINNFQFRDDMCLIQSWYLSNDMQLYIITPIFLILLTRSVCRAAILAGLTVLAGWIVTGILAMDVKQTIYFVVKSYSIDICWKYFGLIYTKPWSRVGPYVVGMACGWLLFKTNCNAKLNKIWVVLGWTLAAACNLSVVYGVYKTETGPEVEAIYHALSRTAWGLGVCWVIFACCNGYGGIVTSFLNHPVWNVLGRLSYSAFLGHVSIVYYFLFNTETLSHYDNGYHMVHVCINNVVYSVLGGLLIFLAFEAPFATIQNLVLKR